MNNLYCMSESVHKELRSVLADWLVFASDVRANDAAGQDLLDGLSVRTNEMIDRLPREPHRKTGNFLSQALNEGDGTYKP